MKKLLIIFVIFTTLSTSVRAVEVTAGLTAYGIIATVKVVVIAAIASGVSTTAYFVSKKAHKELREVRNDAFNRLNGAETTEPLEMAMLGLRDHFPMQFEDSSENELLDVIINDIRPME